MFNIIKQRRNFDMKEDEKKSERLFGDDSMEREKLRRFFARRSDEF